MKKLTIEIVKERLKKINPNILILSGTYINNSTNLKCKCLIDGCEWDITWNMLQRPEGCPECARKNLTLDKIKVELKILNPNMKILSDKYVNSFEHLECECLKDHYIWGTSWDSLRSGTGCPKCGGRVLPTFAEAKEMIKSHNPNIEILSGTYENRTSILKYKCSIDGNEWESTIGNLMNGSNCPVCVARSMSNSNHWNWKGGISSINEEMRLWLIDWKKDSMRQCNYKCAITNQPFQDIHHLYSFNVISKEVFILTKIDVKENISEYSLKELETIKNKCLELHGKYGLGICLTKEVHKLFHSEYGILNNTSEQFKEFVTRLESGEFNDFLKENKLELNINYDLFNKLIN